MTNNAWLLSLATLAASLPGQKLGQEPAAVPPAATAMAFRVPLAADPHEGGLWAAGIGYKASFHDGFAFYPVLGDAYPENLPWRWDTVAVRAGSQELWSAATPLATANASPWRHEIRHGAVTEAYDVRTDGVEQTFVLHAPPAGPGNPVGDLAGDLIVEGRVTSRLSAPDIAAAHGEIVFRDATGHDILAYGAATAVDAAGRRLPIASSFTAGILRLTVPAAWLAGASYPVTIDPLIGRRSFDAADTIVRTDIGHDGVTPIYGLMVALEIAVSSGDHDVIVMLAHGDFSLPSVVYAATSWLHATDPAVAYVAGDARWVFVYAYDDHKIPVTYVYVQPRANIGFGAGGAPLQLGWGGTRPDVGGILAPYAGGHALVVYERASGGSYEIRARAFDPATKAALAEFRVASSTHGQRRPSVNQAARTEQWLVAWEQADPRTGRTSIRGSLVASDGSRSLDSDLTYTGGDALAHKMRPVVAGASGRYVVAYLGGTVADRDVGKQVVVCRVDWPAGQAAGVLAHTRVPFSTVGTLTSLGPLGLAFDHESSSHWALTHQWSQFDQGGVRVSRLGFSGGVVESQVLAGAVTETEHAGAATYDALNDGFVLSYAGGDPSDPLYVDRLAYDPDANTVLFGTSCGGSIGTLTAPDAGNEFFRIRLFDASDAAGPAVLLIGATADVPLDAIGMPGCRLHASPTVVLPVTVLGTSATARVALPDAPVFRGDVAFQYAYLVPGANQLGMRTTRGVLAQVR